MRPPPKLTRGGGKINTLALLKRTVCQGNPMHRQHSKFGSYSDNVIFLWCGTEGCVTSGNASQEVDIKLRCSLCRWLTKANGWYEYNACPMNHSPNIFHFSL